MQHKSLILLSLSLSCPAAAQTGLAGPGPGSGSGGAITVANGADVAEGSAGDAAGANTVIGQLKAINAASTGSSPLTPITGVTSTTTLKGGAGNAYSVGLTNGTTAGCMILYDSASVPASGTALATASIKFHALVAASASYNQDFIWPKAFTSGIQLLFSTTCTTYTTPGTLPILLTGEAK